MWYIFSWYESDELKYLEHTDIETYLRKLKKLQTSIQLVVFLGLKISFSIGHLFYKENEQ